MQCTCVKDNCTRGIKRVILCHAIASLSLSVCVCGRVPYSQLNIHFWKCQLYVMGQLRNGTDQSLSERWEALIALAMNNWTISEKSAWNKKGLFSPLYSERNLFFLRPSWAQITTRHTGTNRSQPDILELTFCQMEGHFWGGGLTCLCQGREIQERVTKW